MDEIRTVRLYGNLGSRFGRIHRLAVASTAEAVRALCVLLPDFEREMMTSGDRGIRYACFIGKTNISKDDLHLAGGGDIRIAPVTAGAKAGFLQTIIGAALVVAGILTTNPYLLAVGVAITLGGVVQMLSPQQAGASAKDGALNQASYNFNGPVNTTAQGNPVPLLYGRMIVGSAVISGSILAEDQAYVGSTKPSLPLKIVKAFFPEYDE